MQRFGELQVALQLLFRIGNRTSVRVNGSSVTIDI
jgi:hypothetical protein